MNETCIVCGSNELCEWDSVGDQKILKCLSCGVGITDPIPALDGSSDFYEKDYYEENYGADGRDFFYWYSEKCDAARFTQVLKGLDEVSPKGKLLDVGCAMGHFLTKAQEAGWEIKGTEASQYASEQTSRLLGVEIKRGSPDEMYQEETFDVVTLHHTLEHVADLQEFFKSVSVVLKKNGVLFIEVPNFNSLEAMLYGNQWEDLRPDQHYYHFTPESISRLLDKYGFDIIRVETRITPFWYYREAYRYLSLPLLFFRNNRGNGVDGDNRNSGSDNSASKRAKKYKRIKMIVNCISKVIFSPCVWAEEKRLMGKRILVYARKAGRRADR